MGLQETFGWDQGVEGAGGCPGVRLLCRGRGALPAMACASHFTPSPASVHESCRAPGRGEDVCQIPSAPFCSPLRFLMNLETNPSAALFAPRWDQSCLGTAAMRSRDAQMQCTDAMHGHDAQPQCTDAIHGHDAWMQCTAAMHGHGAWPQCTGAMHGHDARVQCRNTMHRCNARPRCVDAMHSCSAWPQCTVTMHGCNA